MGVPEPRRPRGTPDDRPTSPWKGLRSDAHPPQMRSKVKNFLGIAVILSILLLVLGSVSGGGGRFRLCRLVNVLDQDLVRQPNMGGQGHLEWQPRSECRNTPHKFDKIVANVTFESGYTLSIEQKYKSVHHGRGRTPTISGQLHVRPSGDSSNRGSVEIEVLSNDNRLTVDTSIDIGHDGKQAITIITPAVLDWWDDNSQAPCIQMRVTVHVPHDGHVDSLGLDVVHLDVELAQGLVMGAIEASVIRSVVGDIRAPLTGNIEDDSLPYFLQSRRIALQTVSGNIKGWFPLYDLLEIDCASGDVHVEIAPRAADEQLAKPAMVTVHSISGKVDIKEPLASAQPSKRLPARDYVVKVETTSGDVKADVAMTSRADFRSVSGDLTLKLLPLLPDCSERTELTTDTTSGTTKVTVLEPSAIDDDVELGNLTRCPALSNLRTSHRSVSGDIKLFYPSCWTGSFKAASMSGSIRAKGKDVKITRSSRRFPKTVEGKKGDGASFAQVGSMSGDVLLYVGQN